jgi:predicted MFS family arabinose efflux permease
MTTETSTAPRATRRPLPFIVPLLAVGTFLMCTTEYIVAGLLQEMSADLGVSLGRVGLLITAFAVGMIVGAPAMALATLRLPRRATLVLALIVFAAGHAAGALSDSFTLVLLARVITALATGAFWSVASVVATDAAGPQDSSRALGVMMSGVGLATVVGVPLGSFAGQVVGWRGAFWGLAVLAAIAAVVIGRLAPADAPDRPSASAAAEVRAVSSRPVWALVLTTVLATGGYMTVFSYVSPLLTDRSGMPAWAIPLVLAGYGVGALMGTNLAGRFADARPVHTFLVATAGTAVVMGLLIPLSRFPAVTIVLIVLLGLFGMGVPPVATGLAVRFAAGAPTLAAAVAVSAFNGGISVGSWAGGRALESALGTTGPAVVGLSMALLALLALLGLRATTRTPGPAAAHRLPVPSTAD